MTLHIADEIDRHFRKDLERFLGQGIALDLLLDRSCPVTYEPYGYITVADLVDTVCEG